jgi:hypothetical protein
VDDGTLIIVISTIAASIMGAVLGSYYGTTFAVREKEKMKPKLIIEKDENRDPNSPRFYNKRPVHIQIRNVGKTTAINCSAFIEIEEGGTPFYRGVLGWVGDYFGPSSVGSTSNLITTINPGAAKELMIGEVNRDQATFQVAGLPDFMQNPDSSRPGMSITALPVKIVVKIRAHDLEEATGLIVISQTDDKINISIKKKEIGLTHIGGNKYWQYDTLDL